MKQKTRKRIMVLVLLVAMMIGLQSATKGNEVTAEGFVDGSGTSKYPNHKGNGILRFNTTVFRC